jgi:hypothetical protein
VPQPMGGETGWWCPSLDDSGNGTTTLNDLVGTAHMTLTNMDAASDWVADTDSGGVRALDFDGSNDVCRVNYSAPTFPFSVSIWVKSRSATLNQFPFALCRSASDEGQFAIRFAGNATGDPVACRHESDAGGTVGESSGNGYTANAWTHVVAVFRSTSYRQVYVNGVASTANTTTIAVPTINRLAIGRLDRLNPAVPLDGRIDDVRIFSAKELNSAEIAFLGSQRGVQPSVATLLNNSFDGNLLVNGGLIS